MIWWFITILLVLITGAVVVFIIIARKGRELRKNEPLPPPAIRAYLEWEAGGERSKKEVNPPFYFGQDANSDVVLTESSASFEVCVFYHNNRFAFQSLHGAGEVLVNGEEKLAGYLWDGDHLKIGQQTFVFRCY